uniref:NADH-ubiquinone oxidoreductase chain 3 n=1 Tax=Lepidonotopodium sp. YZ-2018 TaxID=2153333 RepID=A0A343W682_9ANNE|nr:NADH dehydrogenase subunit 3 [Lepidonotopodium sp. YZ-2018]
MLITSTTIILTLLIPALILMLSMFISFRSSEDQEKCSPFECGFDPKSNARIPFSLRFFLLAVLFLIFDIEIVILMPSPLLPQTFISSSSLITLMLFLLILTIGLFHEWHEGSLNWTI